MQTGRVGLIGYGEVGKIFCAELKAKELVIEVGAWDLKFAAPTHGGDETAHASRAGVTAHLSMHALCQASELIICAVTASNTLAVATEAAQFIRPDCTFLDLNSASPATKQQCAALIDAAGAHYVEAGVMTSVPPYGIKVPMLLGGAGAAQLVSCLSNLGMDVTAVSEAIGVASAIKMCRSVMIKGLEALVIESFATARRYGVEGHVLASLSETFPSIDWPKQGSYFFSRVVQHGRRRAEEMRESANTVREAGYEPVMATAIAQKQQWVADLAARNAFAGLDKNSSWEQFADRLGTTDPK
jgi:3-hydroxyisobutyrate dehydrogenase-like beta-hydroxyacid dehydrogenase